MGSSDNYDVIIIGNGVIGYSIAYELARRSGELRIAVCGPAHRRGAASLAAGAMLNTFGEVTKATLASAAGQAKFELCRRALDRWPSWLEELKEASGDPDLDRTLTRGTTVLLNAKSGVLDNQNFSALEAAFTKFNEPYEEVDPQAVPGLSPLPEARPLRALHVAREGAIDARAVLGGLEAAAAARGVSSVDCEVTGILTHRGRATGVTLGDGASIASDAVVLAAGSFSGPLTTGLFEPGSVPLMFAGRGIAMMTRRATESGFEHVVRTPTRSGNCGLHVVPFGDGREYYGATNIIYDDPADTADFGFSEFLMNVAREQLDQRIFFADIQQWLIGNRPVAIDGFPLIGRTSIEALLVATATYRDGFHCSPIIAQLMADDLLGVNCVVDELPYFVPERAPIELMTAQEAMEELIFSAVSGSYEMGVSLPGWHLGTEPFDQFYRQAVERYYSVLDTPVALLPEVLLSVIFTPDLEKHRVTAYLNAAAQRYRK
jgi:glycine oxidase